MSLSVHGSKQYIRTWYMLPPKSKKAYQELCPFIHSRWYKVQKLVFCLGGYLYTLQTTEPPETTLRWRIHGFSLAVSPTVWFTYVFVKAAKVLVTSCSSNSISLMSICGPVLCFVECQEINIPVDYIMAENRLDLALWQCCELILLPPLGKSRLSGGPC